MKTLAKISDFAGKYMAIIALAVAIIALVFPAPVSAVVKTSYVNILLGIVMFGMGMTLKLADFKVVFTNRSRRRGHPGSVRHHAGAGVSADVWCSSCRPSWP